MEQNFYKCNSCDAVLFNIAMDSAVCIDGLEALKPNTVDASKEKHVPDVSYEGGKLVVKLGSVEHPMVSEHYIPWIFVQTKDGGVYKRLSPNDKPEAVFSVVKDDVVCIYAYCNQHGLWSVSL